MENEENKQEPKEAVSIVDEARAIRDEIAKEREALEKANEEKKKLQAEEMLSGTSGGHLEAKPVVEETSKEYAEKVMKGELNKE